MSLYSKIQHQYSSAIRAFGDAATEQLRIRRHAYAVGYAVSRLRQRSDVEWPDTAVTLVQQAALVEEVIDAASDAELQS